MKLLMTMVPLIFSSLNSFAILNGRDANLANSPAAISVQLDVQGKGTCSGVVVDAHLILTAGHCTEGALKYDVEIKLTNGPDADTPLKLKAKRWQTVPKYTPPNSSGKKEPITIQHDLAYIVVQENLLEKLNISPSQLPKLISSEAELNEALKFSQSKAVSYAYGLFSERRNTVGIKKEIALDVESIFEPYFALKVKSSEKKVAMCTGDSGAGLFVTAQDGQQWLLGINSAVVFREEEGCMAKDSYAVFIMTYRHLCWIQSDSKINLGLNNCGIN